MTVPPFIDELFDRYGVSRESRAALQSYVELLLAWQARINLIGPSTADSAWTRHIADSLQLIPLLPPDTKAIAELGSGAGIPGLVLSIATGIPAYLYESNGKKASFLGEAIRRTGAKASVKAVRLETLAKENVPNVDCVVARALAPLHQLLSYAEPFLRNGAIGLFHKGQDVDLELTESAKYWNLVFSKHQSATDSRGVILEIKEASRV